MRLDSDAWIVANRPERKYLYVGRANARERAKIEPHPKGSKLTYDVWRGKKRFSRSQILPGQYSLNEVASNVAYRTGWNHDFGTDAKNRINRFVRLRKGLVESGIWEMRGRLDWNVPDWFFASVRLADFIKASSHSYRYWSAQMLWLHSQATGVTKESGMPRRVTLFHRIPGARMFGAKIYEIPTAFQCPRTWKAILAREPDRKCAEIMGGDWTLPRKAIRKLDAEYFRDEVLLSFIQPYGIGQFADVPHAQVRLAIALRSIWDRWNEGVLSPEDYAAMPVPPIGWRWWISNAKQDRYHQRACDGVRRWLIRGRPDLSVRVQIDYVEDTESRESQWEIGNGRSELTPREIVSLEGFLDGLPRPFPKAKIQFNELAPIVRDRLAAKYKWARIIGQAPKTDRYPREFRRVHIQKSTHVAPSDDECPF
jgi:hypothetical protein